MLRGYKDKEKYHESLFLVGEKPLLFVEVAELVELKEQRYIAN